MKKEIRNRIHAISILENNWDGYGAVVPSKRTMEILNGFLEDLSQKYLELIHYEDITPSPYGTISIEWSKDNSFINLEIGENGSGYYGELPNGEEPFNDDLGIINTIPNEIIELLKKLYK